MNEQPDPTRAPTVNSEPDRLQPADPRGRKSHQGTADPRDAEIAELREILAHAILALGEAAPFPAREIANERARAYLDRLDARAAASATSHMPGRRV